MATASFMSLSSENINCPKCDSPMINGKMLELLDAFTQHQNIWIEIKSKKEIDSSGIDPESYIAIIYRCSKCVFLESYAKERIYI